MIGVWDASNTNICTYIRLNGTIYIPCSIMQMNQWPRKLKLCFFFGILIYEVCCKNIPENWTINKFLVGSAMRLLAVAELTVAWKAP